MNARQKLIDTAKSLRGQRDSVIDYYNANARPLPLGYRVKYEDQACAVFASVPFLMLEWTSIMPPHCRARELYRNLKALGCAVWGNTRTPIPGDLIFFGYGDKESRIDHVGIFEREENGKLFFWDIRSVVMLHSYTLGTDKSVRDYGYILAWGIPDYASKDTPEPEPAPAPEIGAGDLVKIREGARWYSGSSIKASVMTKNWYVIQNKAGRVVLGMDEDERSNIQSPIHEEDLILVRKNGQEPEPAPQPAQDETVTISITITKDSKELLDLMSQGNHMTYGELIDLWLEDAR